MSRLWWHRTRRVSLITLGVLLTLGAAGALYQAASIRRESGRFPPPGQFVDVGGRRLHFMCVGEGRPTVIFEPSGFGTALSSRVARAEISAHARVCSSDRLGTGWSDPGPDVIPVGTLADDFERLLDRAAVPPPYVLVSSSIGGLTSELFARRHPDRVAGSIFLDAATSDGVERSLAYVNWVTTRAACLGKTAARLGLLRVMDPFDLRRNDTPDEARAVALMYRVEPMATLCGLVRGAVSSAEQFRTAPPIRADVPLTVLSAEDTGPARRFVSLTEKYALHEAMARRSSRGRWQIVPGSSHLIASSQPQAVVRAVLDMLAGIRGPARQPAGPS